MNYKPINFSLPGVGLITVIGKQYETLTDEFIQQWLMDIYYQYQAEPDYMLVSMSIRQDLHRIMMADLHSLRYDPSYAKGEERYPNKITGHPLSIVIFPGLPEKTLFLASLLKMASEEVQVQGHQTVVTRTFDIMTPR